MAWVAIGSAVATTVVGSALSSSGGSSGTSGNAAATAADPFASQRPQYQAALQNLMTGGASAIASDPSYQFRLDQGMTNTDRTVAASGLLNSGNRLTALSDYAQNTASTEYQAQYARLAQLSGANSGNTAAASNAVTSQNAATSATASTIGSALYNAGSSLYNSATGSSSGTGTTTGLTNTVEYS